MCGSRGSVTCQCQLPATRLVMALQHTAIISFTAITSPAAIANSTPRAWFQRPPTDERTADWGRACSKIPAQPSSDLKRKR